MKGPLFAVFLISFLIAVSITAIGLLANWGIWIQSEVVEKGQELPLLKSMVTGVLLASVGLVIELGRRYLKDTKDDMYIDLLGAAVVLPTTNKEEANTAYTILNDYIEEKYEPMDNKVAEKMEAAIDRMVNIRYKGAAKPKTISETLSSSGEG